MSLRAKRSNLAFPNVGLAFFLVVSLFLSSAAIAAPLSRWQALAAQYKQVLARAPDDVQARYNLAMVHAHEGRILDGWNELKALDKQLGDKRPQFLNEVITEARRVLQRSPKDLLRRYRLAFAHYFDGQKGLSRSEFEQIVSLEPTYSWSLGYLGYLHAEAGDLNKGIELWERGVKYDPGNSVLHYVLGIAYTRKGQLKKAASHFVAAYRDRSLYEYVKGQSP